MTISFSILLVLLLGILVWGLSGGIKPSVSITEPPREQPTESEEYDEKTGERLQQEEQERQEQYDRLVQAKNRASEFEFPRLAAQFRAMNGYKDSVKLADECEKKYRSLKERHEEAERKAGSRMALSIQGVEYAFRWCPADTFMMGSPTSEKDRRDNEAQHRVTLTRGFWMLETQVTQEMWRSVMGNNPSQFKDSKKLPVERVSWNDCQEFIKKLNTLGATQSGFRFSLPTEAMWEYACRAGTTTPYHLGAAINCCCVIF